jgi:acetyl esterase/lipase
LNQINLTTLRVLGWLLAGGLVSLSGGCLLPVASPLPEGVKRRNEVTYTPPSWPSPLQADVFYRPGSPPAPAVLLVHGGSWKEDGARWSMNGIARKLAARGFVVVNVSYRGLPHDRYPAPVEDLREAIRWMRRHADEYGIDPRHIATYGFSAGGHLAAQVALRDGNPENVEAIVAASAPFDLTLSKDGDPVPEFLGGTRDKLPERFREASPVNHVTRSSPPIFIYQGSADDVVIPEHAIRMQAAYRKVGKDEEIHWMQGRSHADGFLLPGKRVDEAVDFLDGVMKR